MDEAKLCTRCFEPLQGERACACGWLRGAPSALDGELAPGSALREGRYLVGGVLGRGGFGITYLGWDARLRRRRAIKEYFPRGVVTRARNTAQISILSGQTKVLSNGIQSFLKEAQLLSQFENHPCIVSSRDFFEENETAYLVMEYLQGQTLARYLEQRGGRIPYAQALAILEPVLEALATLHAVNIFHRDVSPENVFLTAQRQPKLLDFGAARQHSPEQTRELTVILREHFAPPEQYAKAGHQGSWTDIYAFGATLYRSISGENAPRSTLRLLRDQIRRPRELGSDIPEPCERALMSALALRPEDRPEIRALLAGLRAGAGEQAPGPALGARLRGALAALRARAAQAAASSTLLGAAIASGALALGVLWLPDTHAPPPVSSGPPSALTAGLAQEVAGASGSTPAPELLPAEPAPIAPSPAPDALAADAAEPPASATPAETPAAAPAVAPAKQVASLLPPRLVVRSNVEGDVVELDGAELGPSGPAGFAVEPGHHKLRVRKVGYVPYDAEIDVKPDGRTNLAVRLLPDTAALLRDARRLLAGPEAEWSKGLELLNAAAAAGDGEAFAELGKLYASGKGTLVAADDAQALANHREAAKRNIVDAQNRLARRLEEGRWQSVTEAGDVLSLSQAERKTLIGRIFRPRTDPPPFLTRLRENTRPGRLADATEAFQWHKAAAMRKDVNSQKRLAYMYAAGRGTKRSEFEALYWFLQAAQQGDAEAQYVVGVCYRLGEGYSRSDEAALCWLRRAAAQGRADARSELRDMGFDPELNGGWENPPKVCNFRGP